MDIAAKQPSARQSDLLEAAYAYVLEHGLAAVSLRPLAAAIGTSPRVLLFLFGSKEGLVSALLQRARADELAVLGDLDGSGPTGLAATARRLWEWLSAEEHRPLLRLWVEAYGRSLVEPEGPWAGFARATVTDWLDALQSRTIGGEHAGAVDCTVALTVLRGGLLDLLATDDESRVSAAVHRQLLSLDTC